MQIIAYSAKDNNYYNIDVGNRAGVGNIFTTKYTKSISLRHSTFVMLTTADKRKGGGGGKYRDITY